MCFFNHFFVFSKDMAVSTISYAVFRAGSSFRVGWRTAGGVPVAIFRDFFATIGEGFILAGALGAGLLFCGVWALS